MMRWHDPDDPDWVIPHIPPSPPVLIAELPEAPFDLRKQHQSTRFPLVVFLITLYTLMWCQLYEPSSRTTPSPAQEPPIDWSRLSLTPPAPVEGDPLNRFKPLYVRPGKPLARLVNDRVILQYNGTITAPLTSLGLEADASYKMETDDLHEYLATLEAFVRSCFPKRDSDERYPTSLINGLRAHFPMHRPVKAARGVPKRVFQVNDRTKTDEDAQATRRALTSWLTMNKGIEIVLRDEEDIERWMLSRFGDASRKGSSTPAPDQPKHDYLKLQGPDAAPRSHGAPNETSESIHMRTFVDLWQDTTNPGERELRTELYRYLVLAVEGGNWVEQGTACRNPLEEWGRITPLPKGWTDPALLLGVKYDASGAEEWNKDHQRPLEINGHILRAARGHPVIIDALRRLYNALQDPNSNRKDADFLTDALMNWLLVRWSIPWSDLRHRSEKGPWRVRDHREWSSVLVLPEESFSGPNVPGESSRTNLQLVVPPP